MTTYDIIIAHIGVIIICINLLTIICNYTCLIETHVAISIQYNAVPFNVLFTAVLCVCPRNNEYVDSINVLHVLCTLHAIDVCTC